MATTSPTRRRVSPGRGKEAVAVEMPAVDSHADEELKTGEGGLPKGASAAASEGGRSVAFFDAAAPGQGSFDMEAVGPSVKVLSPTRTQSTVMQTTGVEICFHQLSLSATYVSKRFQRKTRKILKGISGITRRGTCTALMGPSGCGKTSLLHTLAGKNDKSKVREWRGGTTGVVGLWGVFCTWA